MRHLVVLLRYDETAWVAYSPYVDYIAQGKDIDQVRKAYLEGLTLTVELNFDRFKRCEGFFLIDPRWHDRLDRSENQEIAQLLRFLEFLPLMEVSSQPLPEIIQKHFPYYGKMVFYILGIR